MVSGEQVIFMLSLAASAFFTAISLPFLWDLVPPNRLYGFRTRRTLASPHVWYPVNRVAGRWGVLTGIVWAAVSVWTFVAGITLPLAPMLNAVPAVIGVCIILVHGMIVSRRSAKA